METLRFSRTQVRTSLRLLLLVVSGVLIAAPAYLNQFLFSSLRLNLAVSLAISFQLFVLGILMFILAVGRERLERAPQD